YSGADFSTPGLLILIVISALTDYARPTHAIRKVRRAAYYPFLRKTRIGSCARRLAATAAANFRSDLESRIDGRRQSDRCVRQCREGFEGFVPSNGYKSGQHHGTFGELHGTPSWSNYKQRRES